MNIFNFKYLLKEELLSTQGAKTHLDKHVMVRCPYCGDSIKNMNHGHMGVKINMDDEKDAIVYKCLRCDESGLFTSKTLLELGISDLDLRTDLDKYNKQCNTQGFGDVFNKSFNKYNFIIPKKPINEELIIPKIEYLNKRLGIDGDYTLYRDLNVVFSVPEFIVCNNIKKHTRTIDQLRVFHNDYVGFLTTKKELIINRDITNTHKLRYDVYKVIKNKNDNYTKLFILPFKYDLMTTEKYDIHICEGPMDALGIYFHVVKGDIDNNIYLAVCGSGFKAGVKYLVDRGIFGSNIDLHFYSDSDKPPYFYKKLFIKISKYYNNIYLYYNELSKDCGVPENKIKLLKSKIY